MAMEVNLAGHLKTHFFHGDTEIMPCLWHPWQRSAQDDQKRYKTQP